MSSPLVVRVLTAVNPETRKDSMLPLSPRTVVGGALAFLALCSCLLVSEFDWHRRSGFLIAFDRLSSDPTLCGVGAYDIPWWTLGGYAHLHQNVPILLLEGPNDLNQQAGSFNALLAAGTLRDSSHTFEPAGCFNGICVYRRAGPCAPAHEDNEINAVMRREGL